MTDVWNHVVCPGCGCVCDDISIEFDAGEIKRFSPDCALGERWFRSHNVPAESTAQVNGNEVAFDQAVGRAAEVLAKADYPLVYGLSRSATPGQRAAVALGEQLGGVVDTTASMCHGPSIMAIQEVGEVTSTLGEVRNRADLVIFWGANPAESHPRHAERYSVTAQGRWLSDGRADRKVVIIGDADQVSSWGIDSHGTTPDLCVPIPHGKDFEALAQLRAMLAGQQVDEGVPELKTLLPMMQKCQYGVFFFGLGLAGTTGWNNSNPSVAGQANVSSLLRLVAELNAHSRFTARRMRLQGDVSGADNILCWQTGYPFAVDFSRGYPRYNPGEFTANELLQRGDVDACLLIGAETIEYFSAEARAHLNNIPSVLLDYPGTTCDLNPTVRFTTAVYGLHAPGTIYRMDNVPLELCAMKKSPLTTDQLVLEAISREI